MISGRIRKLYSESDFRGKNLLFGLFCQGCESRHSSDQSSVQYLVGAPSAPLLYNRINISTVRRSYNYTTNGHSKSRREINDFGPDQKALLWERF